MNWNKFIGRADKHYINMNKAIAPLADRLRDFFDDDCVDVFRQTDGWVIVFGDAENTLCGDVDFNELLKMSPQDAHDFLQSRSL